MTVLNRRDVLATAVSVASATTLLIGSARSQGTLNVDELRNLVNSQRDRTLLYLQMDFTISVLRHHIFWTNSELRTLDDFKAVQKSIDWRASLESLYNWLTGFYNGAFSQRLNEALEAGTATELMDLAASRFEGYLDKIAAALESAGIPREGLLARQSLQGMTTVEEINALQEGAVPDRPFLCGFFPFEYFCG